MKRLPFVLPEWMRSAWVSEAARVLWEPRVQAVASGWSEIERASVGRIRRSGIFFIGPNELPALREWCDAQRLSMLPLGVQGADTGQYRASPQSYVGGEWSARTIACEPAVAGEWQEAFFASDNATIGRLLGYPACCSEFFGAHWVAELWVDTTFPMGANSGVGRFEHKSEPKITADERHLDLCTHRARVREEGFVVPADTPPESNILLRWMGLRLVPHLPCSFTCAPTAEFGRTFADLGRSLGKSQEIDWLYEMLSWPVEWSALHGIAEIKTPVFKVSTRTDASPHKWTVQKEGTVFPELGATGVMFPYRLLSSKKVTESKSYLAAIKHEPKAAPWNDNGFGSEAAESVAHSVVLKAAAETGDAAFDVLDLGCGNGKLVADLCGAKRQAFGVEIVEARAARAAKRLGTDRVRAGSLFGSWPEGPFGLVLLMPGRILEVPEGRAAFLERLAVGTNRLLVYAYGDSLTKYGGLVSLTKAAGLTDWRLGTVHKGEGAEAAIALKYVEHEHRCTGACCERLSLNGGLGPEDLRRSMAAAQARIAEGKGAGYDFDWEILVPALEVVREPVPGDPMWFYRCGHHDRERNLCTIFEQRPKLCREYPSYSRGGICGTCGFAPLVQLRRANHP